VKILSFVGARPQFIKEAVLHEHFKKNHIDEILVHSGQHYDFNMSEIFFKVLDLRNPDYNLSIGSGTHAWQTGMMMIELEKVVLKEKPDMILVYGDTNSTLAGALVGAKLKIPVAHVEAGIRQKPKDMPEEINRVLTDRISRYLFCPSKQAVENLKKEGIENGVYFTGDVMYDLFLKIVPNLDDEVILSKHDLEYKEYILVTIHRDFNTDNPARLQNILEALEEISKDFELIFPVHPRTKKRIEEFGFSKFLKNIRVIDPVGYDEMMALTKNSLKVITDSGGLQKEAYFARVPAIILMEDTGWIELVNIGWNVLVDADKNKIIESVINHSPDFSKFNDHIYGDGKAGEKIVSILLEERR
jgi:UDP-N-acetylglucosamine 2-epimerase (non-hydrolysing)